MLIYSIFLSLNDRFNHLVLATVQRSFVTIPSHDRWTIVLNHSIWRSLNECLQRSHFWIVERSLKMIFFTTGERLFSTNPFCDCWAIVFNDPFRQSLNDRVQRLRFVIIERSFPTTPFCRRSDDRLYRSNYTIVERSFSTIPLKDLWQNIS